MNVWNGERRRIHMQEVGTREGFQAEATCVETEEKVALVNALCQTGAAGVAVTAFVSPRAQAVLRGIERRPALIGHDTPSQIVKVDLHPLPADFAVIRNRAAQRSTTSS